MSRRRGSRGRPLDGVLLLDKPAGLSSNAALQSARRLFAAAKGGHTGTLDPLATGLLPLCFGEATKFAGELLNADKRYEAIIELGVTTDSGDACGKVLATAPVSVTRDALERTLAGFRGEIMQVPPMHSALKHQGKPLYQYARAGIEIPRDARGVSIHALELTGFEGNRVALAIDCSKGTYVRTLAQDLGAALGCGAHLAGLRRSRIGWLTIEHSVTLAQLERSPFERRDDFLLPVDALLEGVPRVVLEDSDAARISHGQPVRVPESASALAGQRVRAYGGGRFLGLCVCSDGWLKPLRLIAEPAPVAGGGAETLERPAEKRV